MAFWGPPNESATGVAPRSRKRHHGPPRRQERHPIKTCSKCGIEKPLGDFSGDPRGSQKRHAYCRKCQAIYNAAYLMTPEGRAKSLIHGAARRRPVTVTREWVVERIRAGICEATGIPFDLAPRKDGGHQNPLAPSLDRKDPAGDYTPDNTQVVIFAYNTAKGQLTDDVARALIKRMAAGL